MSTDTELSFELIASEVLKLRPFVRSNKLELVLSCRNLFSVDMCSKSPYCIAYTKERLQDEWREIGRTENMFNTVDPKWIDSVDVHCNSLTEQHLMFEVLDSDCNGSSKFLGAFETTVEELIPFLFEEFVARLEGPSKRVDYGEIVIVTGIMSGCRQFIDISFSAQNLKKLSWFHKNCPFLVINRLNSDGTFSVIATTDIAQETQNPIWDTVRMRASSLCRSNLDHVIRIDCFDYRTRGHQKLIGSCLTSIRKLSYSALVLTKFRDDNITGTLKIHRIQVL